MLDFSSTPTIQLPGPKKRLKSLRIFSVVAPAVAVFCIEHRRYARHWRRYPTPKYYVFTRGDDRFIKTHSTRGHNTRTRYFYRKSRILNHVRKLGRVRANSSQSLFACSLFDSCYFRIGPADYRCNAVSDVLVSASVSSYAHASLNYVVYAADTILFISLTAGVDTCVNV